MQHDFADHKRPSAPDPGHALGSPPTLGQITLRIRDPEPSLRFYADALGMRLLSRQIVEPHRFTLYFLACTEESPPSPSLDSVDNREWLWRRPYTTLELQHVWGTERADLAYRQHEEGAPGFWGAGFVTKDLPALVGALARSGARVAAPLGMDPWLGTTTAVVLDPDGCRLRFASGTASARA